MKRAGVIGAFVFGVLGLVLLALALLISDASPVDKLIGLGLGSLFLALTAGLFLTDVLDS